MKKLRKVISKIMASVLTLGMLFTTLPIKTFAATAYEVWVRGTQITQSNASDVLGDGKVSYNAENGTLTLNGALIRSEGMKKSAIIVPDGTTINLLGENTISTDIFYAIESDGAITIKGSGKLDATSPSKVIYTKGNINISDSVIVAESTSIAQTAIHSEEGNIAIDNAADITANGTECGLKAKGNILINRSKVKAKGLDPACGAIHNENGSLSITEGSNVVADGYGYGIRINGNLIIKDSIVKASATDLIDENDLYGIFVGGTNSVTISGTSDVIATGGWAGLRTYGETTISGGKLEAIAYKDDWGIIVSNGPLNITGGLVHAKGSEGNGAIAVIIKNNPNVPKIVLSDMVEKNGGHVAATNITNVDATNWTAFIAKDETTLQNNRSNALNEVWIGSTICAFGHDYSSEFTEDKAPTCSEEGSKSKHCSRCDSKSEVTSIPSKGHKWDKGIITTEPTYTVEGIKTFTCTVCAQTKTESISKLPSKEVVIDSFTQITVEYEDGKVFDDSIELSVTSLSKEELKKYDENINKVAKGFFLAGLYDIKLLKDGIEIQPDSMVKITIPLSDEMKAMVELKVVYIDENGKITIIPSEVINGKLVFMTKHFSYYGVIGMPTDPLDPPNPTTPQAPSKDKPDTADSVSTLPIALLGLSSLGITVLLIIFKKQKFKVNEK